jgi:hypothetical protein
MESKWKLAKADGFHTSFAATETTNVKKAEPAETAAKT